jgi:tetratricopeptide (TPR) repeat protein
LDRAADQFAFAEQCFLSLVVQHEGFVLDRVGYGRALLGRIRALRRLGRYAEAMEAADLQIREAQWAIVPSDERPATPALHGEWLRIAAGWQDGPSHMQSPAVLALRLGIDISARGRSQLAVAYDERGLLHLWGGRLPQAERDFERARELRAPMDGIEMAEFQLGAARHHRYKSRLFEARDNPTAALAELEEADRRMQPWYIRQPLSLEMRHELFVIQLAMRRLKQQLLPGEVSELDRQLTTQRLLLSEAFPECRQDWAGDPSRE